MEDILELAWATEAFGEGPDAINLWIGGAASHTSFHKAGTPLNKYRSAVQQHSALCPPLLQCLTA